MSKSNILICVSGSIAAYKAASLASALMKDGYNVRCTATEKALEFVGIAALEGITHQPVLTDMFNPSWEIPHINLPEWADLILLYPASASSICRLRTGAADDLASAIFLANNFRKPYWIAPAMNVNMLENPATQENLKILEQWGATILPTEEGVLACGAIGKGKVIPPEICFQRIKEFL